MTDAANTTPPAKVIDPVYYRLAGYILSSAIAALPAWALGWVEVDMETLDVVVHTKGIITGLGGGAGISALIFKLWGKK